MIERSRSLPVFLAFVLALAGCPPATDKKPLPTDPNACAKIGQSCEFAPGKLGTCVQRDDCTGPHRFVCQSQH